MQRTYRPPTLSNLKSNSRQFAGEWLTGLMIAATLASWISLTLVWQSIPIYLLPIAGGLCLAFYSSLQHEAIHGHPTCNRRFNLVLVGLPLLLWLPISHYEKNHRAHHRNELTRPDVDPESWYVTAERWQRMSTFNRLLSVINNTFAGRMIIGPLLTAYVTFKEMVFGTPGSSRSVIDALTQNALHLIGVLLVIGWLWKIAVMPIHIYLLAFVWPATSLLLIRSFVEHRYDNNPEARTAIVEGCAAMRLLFLNNNYHVVHHRYPSLPWYRIPDVYRQLSGTSSDKQPEVSRNVVGGPWYAGYANIARRFSFSPWTSPIWPGESLSRDAINCDAMNQTSPATANNEALPPAAVVSMHK